MIRKRCVRHGHRWIASYEGYRPPVQGCARWFCEARRPDPLMSVEMRETMQQYIDAEEAAR